MTKESSLRNWSIELLKSFFGNSSYKHTKLLVKYTFNWWNKTFTKRKQSIAKIQAPDRTIIYNPSTHAVDNINYSPRITKHLYPSLQIWMTSFKTYEPSNLRSQLPSKMKNMSVETFTLIACWEKLKRNKFIRLNIKISI